MDIHQRLAQSLRRKRMLASAAAWACVLTSVFLLSLIMVFSGRHSVRSEFLIFQNGLLAAVLLLFLLPAVICLYRFFEEQAREKNQLTKQILETNQFQQAMYSILEDAQKAHQEAARAMEASSRLAAIVESSQDAIIGETLDGIITSWNKGAERLYGYRDDEIIGKPMGVLFETSQKEDAALMLGRLRAGRRVRNFEAVGVAKDGRFIHVSVTLSPVRDGSGKLAGVSAIARDITVQKRQNERLRTVVEAAPNGMVMVDSSIRIVLVNSAVEKIFGCSRNTLYGKLFDVLLPERFRFEDEKSRLIFFTKLGSRYSPTEERDLQCIRFNGAEFPVEMYINPLITEEGAFILIAIVDISEKLRTRQALEEAMADLKAANERLQELDRLKSDFLMTASHELRTPLSTLKGYAALILQGMAGPVNETQREFLHHIRLATDRLHRLVNELLNLTRIESGQIELKMSNAVIEDILKEEVMTFQADANKKKINLQFEAENELGTLWCDTDRVAEIMDNLISNALKYTMAGGWVRVTARKDQDLLTIRVQDSGVGIPQEKIGDLFQPFHTAHKKGLEGEESIGLGLALVKALVEKHHGTVSVESQPPAGSTFTVIFQNFKNA